MQAWKRITASSFSSSKRLFNHNIHIHNYNIHNHNVLSNGIHFKYLNRNVVSRGFSSTGDKNSAPEEFFDEVVEKDKMYFDAVSVLTTSGLEKMTIAKSTTTWKDVETDGALGRKLELHQSNLRDVAAEEKEIDELLAANKKEQEGDVFEMGEANEVTEMMMSKYLASNKMSDLMDEDGDEMPFAHAELANPEHGPVDPRTVKGVMDPLLSTPDLANHLQQYEDLVNLPAEMISFTQPQYFNALQHPNTRNIPFFRPEDPDKYRFDQKGMRACGGKRQRRGLKGALKCHLIDLDALNFMDVQELRRFQTQHGEIARKSETGLCSKCQRTVAKHIKRARAIGFLPHQGSFGVRDINPVHHTFDDEPYHAVVSKSTYVVSNSILK